MKKLLGIGKKVKFGRKQFLLVNFNKKNLLKMKMTVPQLHHLKTPQDQFLLSSSTKFPTSSSSSLSSTPRKMRSLSDIYERCNFYIIEPQSFEEAIKDKDWRKAMEKEIDVIEKNET